MPWDDVYYDEYLREHGVPPWKKMPTWAAWLAVVVVPAVLAALALAFIWLLSTEATQ